MRWAVLAFAVLFAALAVTTAIAAVFMQKEETVPASGQTEPEDTANAAEETAAVTEEVTDENRETETAGAEVTEGQNDVETSAETSAADTAAEVSPAAIETGVTPLSAIRVAVGDTVLEMGLEDFVAGSLMAEMPSYFDMEALKAGAVAIRSCAVHRMLTPSIRYAESHHGADICTAASHCMAYTTEQAIAAQYGEKVAAECCATVRAAVDATCGQIITYRGEVCQAAFHSMSEGCTETCADVWGGRLDYLVSVPAPEDDSVPNLHTTVTHSRSEVAAILCDGGYSVSETDPVSIVLDDAGYVYRFCFGDACVSGTEARFLFGLRSARFSVADDGTTLVFSVGGYGHGVGMSQYGADCLAKAGMGYEEILKYYYTGVDLTVLR